MKAFQDSVYIFELNNSYTLMLQRDIEDYSAPVVNFYMKKKSAAHWIHCFVLDENFDYSIILGDEKLVWNNMEHINKIVKYYEKDFIHIEQLLYEKIIGELENAEEKS